MIKNTILFIFSRANTINYHLFQKPDTKNEVNRKLITLQAIRPWHISFEGCPPKTQCLKKNQAYGKKHLLHRIYQSTYKPFAIFNLGYYF